MIFDTCHCIKLVRNTFASLKVMVDKDGRRVEYKYLEELEKLQSSEGLLAANKLRKKHINFHNMKIKICEKCKHGYSTHNIIYSRWERVLYKGYYSITGV
uniref:DNA transposase THAP9like [Danio rerio] n=1 Tax=Lepeophtheirus salmonis TaxID=72036 RepID=A0A0K2U609_LEPSM